MRKPSARTKAPPASVREYIRDMLRQLAEMARSSGEADLASSLQETAQKVQNGEAESAQPS